MYTWDQFRPESYINNLKPNYRISLLDLITECIAWVTLEHQTKIKMHYIPLPWKSSEVWNAISSVKSFIGFHLNLCSVSCDLSEFTWNLPKYLFCLFMSMWLLSSLLGSTSVFHKRFWWSIGAINDVGCFTRSWNWKQIGGFLYYV